MNVVNIEKVKSSAIVEAMIKELSQALSGAMGIAQTMRETDYSALTEPEDPIRMFGLADGLGVILDQMFSNMQELKYELGLEDPKQAWDAFKKAQVQAHAPAETLGTNDVKP